MLFSSLAFLWIFLPAVLGGNLLLSVLPFKSAQSKIRSKNAFLLAASLFFYGWGNISYLGIMVTSIAINWAGGMALQSYDRAAAASRLPLAADPLYDADRDSAVRKKRKLTLIFIIAANLAMLFYFKYFNFLIVVIEAFAKLGEGIGAAWNSLLHMESGTLGIAEVVLPIGISFFTFQALSYVIDVYTRKTEAQFNPGDFALYVSFFPQLIAGPIVKYGDVNEQLASRKENLSLFLSGFRRFSYGLAKKVLLANSFALVVDRIFEMEIGTIGASIAWVGIILYAFQIYFDFSGYSDMAIGLGRMFGFKFAENFDYPYTSLSIREFWRRWHISLSSWFKEYIYIPLGGNRKGVCRTYLNLFIVFLITGIWHGANLTFLFWGIYYGFFIVIERLFLGRLLEKNPIKPLNWIYTFFVVLVGWVFFRAPDLPTAFAYLGQMFGAKSRADVFALTSMTTWIALAIGIVFCGFAQRPLRPLLAGARDRTVFFTVDCVWQLILIVYCIFVLASGTYNPFIYFQF